MIHTGANIFNDVDEVFMCIKDLNVSFFLFMWKFIIYQLKQY